ncbi:hypothetical protein SteCoe_28890 [Stentor coeruleus]|uniref:SPIN90/Ldb17 leucine-rich domain-containing protein n=1 Tax=Stentor coeruleus TaxID=5963 RepID=A0A1R2B797_9CILI|nr:hypothetical protein SteCoe_28890 [Stentor coeruleus]
MEAELEVISKQLTQIAKNPHGTRADNWLHELASPETGFIGYLLTNIDFDNYSPPIYITLIRQFVMLKPPGIFKEIKETKRIRKKMQRWMSNNEMSKAHSDMILWYLAMCQDDKECFKIDDNIFSKIMDYTEIIEGDEQLNPCMSFIKNHIKSHLSVYLTHKNAILTTGLMLFMLNRSEEKEKLDYLTAVFWILQENFDLFYTNDLKSLADILYDMLSMHVKTYNFISLSVLLVLFSYEDFSLLNYKVQEFIELIREIEYEDSYASIKEMLLEVLINLIGS